MIRTGGGRMPAFSQLTTNAVDAVAEYLLKGDDKEVVSTIRSNEAPQMDYTFDGYNKLLDPDGYPGIKPPWGTLTPVNLNKGVIAWQVPLGEYPQLAAKGMTNTGSENYGGPVVTAGGLLFIGATIYDNKFRVFDKQTGQLLWQIILPAAGNATPAIYQINGRENVVIACGGGKWGAKSGGSYVAFSL